MQHNNDRDCINMWWLERSFMYYMPVVFPWLRTYIVQQQQYDTYLDNVHTSISVTLNEFRVVCRVGEIHLAVWIVYAGVWYVLKCIWKKRSNFIYLIFNDTCLTQRLVETSIEVNENSVFPLIEWAISIKKQISFIIKKYMYDVYVLVHLILKSKVHF